MFRATIRLLAPLALVAAGCQGPTHISIDPKQPTLKGRQESVQLIGHVMTNTVEDAKARVTWKSEMPEIASVDEGGKVSGRSGGRATIVATYGDLRAQVPVDVSWVEQVRADTDHVDISFDKGDPAKVKVEALGYDGRVLKDRMIQWKSENDQVCRPDTTGQLWPVNKGETQVVASFDDVHLVKIRCTVTK